VAGEARRGALCDRGGGGTGLLPLGSVELVEVALRLLRSLTPPPLVVDLVQGVRPLAGDVLPL
jgi:hypothetical protein